MNWFRKLYMGWLGRRALIMCLEQENQGATRFGLLGARQSGLCKGSRYVHAEVHRRARAGERGAALRAELERATNTPLAIQVAMLRKELEEAYAAQGRVVQ